MWLISSLQFVGGALVGLKLLKAIDTALKELLGLGDDKH